MSDPIAKRIREFLLTSPVYRDLLPKDFADDFGLVQSGALDSIGIFELVVFLEEQLGIKVDPADINEKHFRDLNAITRFARERQAKA